MIQPIPIGTQQTSYPRKQEEIAFETPQDSAITEDLYEVTPTLVDFVKEIISTSRITNKEQLARILVIHIIPPRSSFKVNGKRFIGSPVGLNLQFVLYSSNPKGEGRTKFGFFTPTEIIKARQQGILVETECMEAAALLTTLYRIGACVLDNKNPYTAGRDEKLAHLEINRKRTHSWPVINLRVGDENKWVKIDLTKEAFKFEPTRQRLKASKSLSPKEASREQLISAAYLFLFQENQERMLSCLKAAYSLDPSDKKTKEKYLEALMASGLTAFTKGALDTSYSCYTQAYSLNPYNPEILINIANILAEQKNYQGAMLAYANAVNRLNTGLLTWEKRKLLGIAHKNMGTIKENLGEKNEAVEYYMMAASFGNKIAAQRLSEITPRE
ncbi:hypothetical protein A2246_00410 [candidate division WOR-1 bacterium RIFOXYA2_FULL_37_7]|uniref:Uncharacterized protein n=1 Tax=candidate division WOR-1 bacterium RIFOXYB2_FULL_37_13 TaxID=1802579 RepID=A0A1F4SYA4_UNCSA|nr:MAG: hypothetical protein A2246_00410 [candidate division WOR-1 bacterium RIFOXYA2_FULL_37_7]OGC24723.1 MAG: hypothetical protein A2310_04480 [candidate division WOR-1 bacterium RIFOXYB2_FULL_37_13]